VSERETGITFDIKAAVTFGVDPEAAATEHRGVEGV
jgi:hypothetical protein